MFRTFVPHEEGIGGDGERERDDSYVQLLETTKSKKAGGGGHR
jgi:hypothetical protein